MDFILHPLRWHFSGYSTGINLFFPQTAKGTTAKENLDESDNLIFYKDIAKYSKEKYIRMIFKQYMQMDCANNKSLKLEEDLADEITYNARIIVWKYQWFKWALAIDVIAFGILIVAFVVA